MKRPSLKLSDVAAWNKARRQKNKEKEELERSLEGPALRMATFIITLIAMAFGMSFLSLFPQPVPILLAVIVAFAAYRKPRFGMPIGGAIIGVGLLYHLSELYFISFLGDTPARVAFIVIWMTLFVALPAIFNRYKSALAVDFGILAVMMLFFEPTYFLAIPLIFASAVFFKKYVGLTVVYYVLLSVPLQLIQYYNYIVEIVRDDWWLAPGSAPPLFVSLSSIAGSLDVSLTQFRLYDTANFIYKIAGQTTWVPDWTGRTIKDALTQYLDSLPGILMFVIIVVGLSLALIFFTRALVKGGLIGSGDRFFPCFTATIGAALFFIMLSALQKPLAFTADISPSTMILGIIGTTILTSPVLFMDYAPKRRSTNQEIKDKAQVLLNKVLTLEAQLSSVEDNIPVNVSSPQGKVQIMKDELNDTINKASLRMFEQTELDEKFNAIEKLNKDYDIIEAEFSTILSEYHVFSTCEFANWTGKLKVLGLDIKTEVMTDFQKDMPLEQRIEAIKQVISAGRNLVLEVTSIAEPIYGIIRPLYDPELSQQSKAITFATEKLSKNEAPWIAVEALYNALNNWHRQYSRDIQATMKYLKSSLKPISYLKNQSEVLPAVFGNDTPKVLGYSNKAEDMRALAEKRAEKEELDLLDIIGFKDDVYSYVAMANDIISMLYSRIVQDEDTITSMLPVADYLWGKNGSLRERLEEATNVLSDPSKFKINEVMENLSKYLVYMDESVQTMISYAERKELLLNYPLAEAVISERLKQKECLLPSDLPFRPYFAAEFLRIYYTQRYSEYVFDKENFSLSKRK